MDWLTNPVLHLPEVSQAFVLLPVFLLCWSPNIVFDLLQVHGYIPQMQSNIAIATLINSLAPSNIAAHPADHYHQTNSRFNHISFTFVTFKAKRLEADLSTSLHPHKF